MPDLAVGEVVSLFLPSSDALRDGKEIKWSDAMYPDLHMPFAPSWSLHWAYRDGRLVNLPVSLLVEGDIIALRPGQESFASLRGIKVVRGFSPPLLNAVGAPTSNGGRAPGLNSAASWTARRLLGKGSRRPEKSWDIFPLLVLFFSLILKQLGVQSCRFHPSWLFANLMVHGPQPKEMSPLGWNCLGRVASDRTL